MQAKLIHVGQYQRYGDTFRVWEIATDGESKEEVLRYARENLYKRDIPPENEWRFAVRWDGEHRYDPAYYFRGYYLLTEIEGGYKFTVVEPFCD